MYISPGPLDYPLATVPQTNNVVVSDCECVFFARLGLDLILLTLLQLIHLKKWLRVAQNLRDLPLNQRETAHMLK